MMLNAFLCRRHCCRFTPDWLLARVPCIVANQIHLYWPYQCPLSANFYKNFLTAFQLPDTFSGLFARWIRYIKPKDLGNFPSGISKLLCGHSLKEVLTPAEPHHISLTGHPLCLVCPPKSGWQRWQTQDGSQRVAPDEAKSFFGFCRQRIVVVFFCFFCCLCECLCPQEKRQSIRQTKLSGHWCKMPFYQIDRPISVQRTGTM